MTRVLRLLKLCPSILTKLFSCVLQDVMLSGTSTQSPISTVSGITIPTFSMPTASMSGVTMGTTTYTGTLPDNLFLSAVHSMNHDTAVTTHAVTENKPADLSSGNYLPFKTALHICMYICKYIYIYIYTCIYLYIYIYTHTHIHIIYCNKLTCISLNFLNHFEWQTMIAKIKRNNKKKIVLDMNGKEFANISLYFYQV